MSTADAKLEKEIAGAYERLLKDWCSTRWQMLAAMIRRRSARQVEKMERSQGLIPAGTYADRLKDPWWQRRRLEVMSREDFHCQRCGRGDKPLHVHHKYYERGRAPWDYPDSALACLCEDCHESQHPEKREA